jgi:hypothetical protein
MVRIRAEILHPPIDSVHEVPGVSDSEGLLYIRPRYERNQGNSKSINLKARREKWNDAVKPAL